MDIGLYPVNPTRFILDCDPIRVQAMTYSAHSAFDDIADERAAFQVAYSAGVLTFPGEPTRRLGESPPCHRNVGDTDDRTSLLSWTPRGFKLSADGTSADLDYQGNQMCEEFEYFAHCVFTEAQPYAHGTHGLVDMRTIGAMYKAARTGESVEL